MVAEAERKWLLGQQRQRQIEQLKKQRQEVAHDKQTDNNETPEPTLSESPEAIRRRNGGIASARGEAVGTRSSGQPAQGNRKYHESQRGKRR